MSDFFAIYGGAIMTVVSGIMSVVISVTGFLIVRLVKRIDCLERSQRKHQADSSAAESTMVSEIKVAARTAEHIAKSLDRTEGRIDEQQKVMIILGEKIAIVTTKLDAVFREIDARRRATDN